MIEYFTIFMNELCSVAEPPLFGRPNWAGSGPAPGKKKAGPAPYTKICPLELFYGPY